MKKNKNKMIKDTIQQRIKQQLEPYSDTILDCSIRVGKTKIALDKIQPDEKVLWIYPRVSMTEGYDEDIIKFPPLSDNITFTTTRSLKKYKDQHFDRVIIDEPQELSTAQIKHLKTIKYNHRLGLSGSLNKRTLEKLNKELNWKVYIKYSLEDAIKDGLVKNYKINIHMIDMNNTIKNVEFKKYGKIIKGTEQDAYEALSETVDYFDNKVQECILEKDRMGIIRNGLGTKKYINLRTNLIYNSTTLFQYAVNLINKLNSDKLLVYTLRTEIADLLGDTSFHTKNRDEEMLNWFKNSQEGCMATVNCITTGITIKNLYNVLFHAFESNSETFLQKLGRSLYFDEDENKHSNIHVCVLKNTQAEKWIEYACDIIEDDKIIYIYKNKSFTKVEWLKFKFPNNPIYQIKESGAYILENGKNGEGFTQYFFPTNPDRNYTYAFSKLNPIK